MENEIVAKLALRIENKSAKVGVIGMGYVGLPLSILFAEAGFELTGFDLDPKKAEAIRAGETYIRHISADSIAAVVTSGKLQATTDFRDLAEMDAIIICVPTPLGRNREPDLQFVISTSETIAKHLRHGQLVVLESTTYPGTTREVVRPILEASGLKSGKDFYLAYSPEREDPGNQTHRTATIPKVLGGDGEAARELTQALYGSVVKETVPVSSMDTAEAVKLTENIFRAVNIALVNELKMIYTDLGIDVWEVIQAASTKPFGFMPFYPGPGLGGHCIPIDPFYLSWRARQVGRQTRFIELSGEINSNMPGYVVDNLEVALETRFGKSLRSASVLIIGIAYKKNCDDLRESPGLVIIELLEERGATTAYHDPYIPTIPNTREHKNLFGRSSVPIDAQTLGQFDAVLICADHDDVSYELLVEGSKLVVDTRNAASGVSDHSKVVAS